ncbi:MAG: RNA methyltransferase [Anaerolineales bacterium]|jgi:TrmH family RNA methyltransferase
MITSTKNARIKEVRALQAKAKTRREVGAFVVEGVRLGEEALQSGWLPIEAFYTKDLNERGQVVLAQLRTLNVPVEEVAPHVMKAAGDTQSSQGLLLVMPMKPLPVPDHVDFALIADVVRDPGNLGTLLRSAAAAGVQVVFLGEESVDAFSPKVVRGAMGAHFRLPIHSLNYEDMLSQCERHDLRVLVTAAGEGSVYTEEDLTQPVAIVVGGEAEGARPPLTKKADGFIHIPMPGGGESLNAGVAGSVVLFEVVRQRH